MIIGIYVGYFVIFDENIVCDMGWIVLGVCGICFCENDYVVGVVILDENKEVLVIIENGYGKCIKVFEYLVKGCGGKGIKIVNIIEKNGLLVGLIMVNGDEDILLIMNKGVIICFNVDFVF